MRVSPCIRCYNSEHDQALPAVFRGVRQPTEIPWTAAAPDGHYCGFAAARVPRRPRVLGFSVDEAEPDFAVADFRPRRPDVPDFGVSSDFAARPRRPDVPDDFSFVAEAPLPLPILRPRPT